MKKRILVNEDSAKLKEIELTIQDERNNLLNRAVRFVSSFNSLGIEQMDNNLFLKVIKDGVDEYADKSLETLRDQFKKSGITMDVVMKPAFSDQEIKIRNLKADYIHLLSYNDRVSKISSIQFKLEDISINENLSTVIKLKDFEDVIDSYSRTFIDDQLGLKLHKKGEELAALFNEINDIIKTAGGYNINDVVDFADLARWKWKNGSEANNAESIVNTEGVYQLTKQVYSYAEKHPKVKA